jgi:tRNA threonylcarbamoyladenosine biosynthesis protein TsaE
VAYLLLSVFSRYYTERMNTGMIWRTKSTSSEATEQLAEKLGRALKGGEVIELVSDLGGGKTTFVRGLARGAGSKDSVSSPTFTISKVYDAQRFQIHHFDFYRLHEAGVVADEIAEVAHDPAIVTVVEWGDIVQHVLPTDRLTVRIAQTPEGSRELVFNVPTSLRYVIEALQQ